MMNDNQAHTCSATEKAIRECLAATEREHGVSVLYAIESGSRAWGFPSLDSDYDVRFIYAHPPAWYFSMNIEDLPDVIEHRLDNVLDVNGWDLRKALRLLARSNVPLFEWLLSPVHYCSSPALATLHALMRQCYSSTAFAYHHLSLVMKVNEKISKGDRRLKTCFYGLRSAFTLKWIDSRSDLPPMALGPLMTQVPVDVKLATEIADLRAHKAITVEADQSVQATLAYAFIAEELARWTSRTISVERPRVSYDDLNHAFRTIVESAYAA